MTDSLSMALSRIGNQYRKVLMVNLTKGTYSTIYTSKEEEGSPYVGEDLFLALLWQQEFERDIIFPDDRANVEKLVNMDYLRKFFAKYHGEEYYWVRYR